MAQRFNPSTVERSDEPIAVAEQVGQNPVTGRGFFSVSDTGVLTFVNAIAPNTLLVWFDGTGPTFVRAVPEPLFDTSTSRIFPGGFSASYYAVSKDGQRFIVNTLVGDSTATPLTVFLNWSAGVKS